MKGFSMRRKLRRIVDAVRLASFRFQNWALRRPATTGFPRYPTLIDLQNEVADLLKLEVSNGCFGPIEMMVENVAQAIRQNRVLVPRTSDEEFSLERSWDNLLRLGLFEELRMLLSQHQLPLRPEVRTVIDFCAHAYEESRRRGEAYRAKHPGKELFAAGCIVWGDEYVGNFLRYNLRSMLSKNNLPALCAQGCVVFSIVTDAAGERHMRGDAWFAEIADLVDIEFTIVTDELRSILSKGHLVRDFYILYGMLDHCSIFFAQGAACHLFMIPVDAIVADGSLANMANYRLEGFECCGGGNIVANTEAFLPALDQRFGDEGPIDISAEELATLAAAHAHHYFTSQIVAVENSDFGKHPREIFWPVDGGVRIHSVFVHPLFTTATGLANYRRKHFANIDYGMIPRMFSGSGRIKIIEDPREAYVNNFTGRGRLYETTGRPFAVEDVLRAHDNSYPIQKSLITRSQLLPCRLEAWTAYRDVKSDVHEINAQFEADRTVRADPRFVGTERELTIILPTRNRTDLCRAQIRFLQRCGIRHRVIVADSSDNEDRSLREACTGAIAYLRFDPSTSFASKMTAATRSVATPYVALIPDDDISFLHTIDACVDFLRHHPTYVVAQGYVLGGGMVEGCFDIHSVQWFVPSVVDPTSLKRLYELVRRYQPFFWAVFRTEAYCKALEATVAAKGVIFQELTFNATLAMLGHLARLPLIHTLRGDEVSHTIATESHPLFWFLKNPASFFSGYVRYRKGLIDQLRVIEGNVSAQALSRQDDEALSHVLDIIHAAYLGREVDMGKIHHIANILLDDASRLQASFDDFAKSDPRDTTIREGDLTSVSSLSGRRYIWRASVLNAEPRSEIMISCEEIAKVTTALDHYSLP